MQDVSIYACCRQTQTEAETENGVYAESFARLALTESLQSTLMLLQFHAGTKGLPVSDVQSRFWRVTHALDAAGI